MSLMKSRKFVTYAKKKFNTDKNDKNHHKVRDHCHYRAKFRGAAHNICNLKYRTSKETNSIS